MSHSVPSRRNLVFNLAAVALPIWIAASSATAPARAAEWKKDAGDPLIVELTNVVEPVARDGNLTNYLFLILKIHCADNAGATFVREQHFFVRDAITRLVSRTPIPPGATRGTYDAATLNRVVVAAVQAARPGTRVTRVTVDQAGFMRP